MTAGSLLSRPGAHLQPNVLTSQADFQIEATAVGLCMESHRPGNLIPSFHQKILGEPQATMFRSDTAADGASQPNFATLGSYESPFSAEDTPGFTPSTGSQSGQSDDMQKSLLETELDALFESDAGWSDDNGELSSAIQTEEGESSRKRATVEGDDDAEEVDDEAGTGVLS